MRQLIYGMQFTGQAVPVETSPGVLHARTSAPSCNITSLIGPEGLAGIVNLAAGGTAGFESEVTFTDESSFLESGRISFGNDGDSAQLGKAISDPPAKTGNATARSPGASTRGMASSPGRMA
jgi:hypothetical protein